MHIEHFVTQFNTGAAPFTQAYQVGAVPGGECFLLLSPQASVLVDSGFGFCGREMVRRVEEHLAGRPLDFILLTHSHYDHVLGSAWALQRWPQARVIASEYCARILQKPSALATMAEMDEAARIYYNGETVDQGFFDYLRVDETLADGEETSLNGLTMRCVALPGHTKCSVGFYFPDSRLLLGCETLGVYTGGDRVIPSYLVGFAMTVASIKKAMDLPMDTMLVSHLGMIYGDDCKQLLSLSLYWMLHARDILMADWKAGKGQQELVERFRELFYREDLQRIQPEKAFYLNTGYTVAVTVRECAETRPDAADQSQAG